MPLSCGNKPNDSCEVPKNYASIKMEVYCEGRTYSEKDGTMILSMEGIGSQTFVTPLTETSDRPIDGFRLSPPTWSIITLSELIKKVVTL